MRPAHHRFLLMLATLTVSGTLAACDEPTVVRDRISPPEDVRGAPLTGTIDTLTARAPFLSGVVPRSGGAGQKRAPNPDSVFAGIPGSAGNIQVGSKAALRGPDRFSLEVNAGRRSLIVAVGRGAHVDSVHNGRVLVFTRTRSYVEIVTEPLNMETTLEGAVLMRANLGEFTIPRGLLNNPQIGLVHRLPDGVARPAATDTGRIRNLALAYKRAQETMIRSFRSTLFDAAFDSTALNAGLRADAAQPYADARANGTDIQTAHDRFIQDAVQVYADSVGNPQALSVAWGAFGTKHDQRMAVPLDDGENPLPEDPARLMMARNILAITTEVRRKILEDLSDSPARTAVSDALSAMVDAGMAATDMSTFRSDLANARQNGLADLEAKVGDLPESDADLGAYIDATASPAEIAQNLPAFMNDLEAAVPDDTNRALLLAIMGGPGYAS